ncbi:MAG: DUF4974 domain-containing protein [Muribaculaceae bacterium]|nr:DUF4974 domain-containing protein [Muribaculaceae bacterium]
MRDKIDQLLDILENSEKYSEQELHDLLQDPDFRKLYDTICKTSDALSETPEVDVDKEWEKFYGSQSKIKHIKFSGLFSRSQYRNIAVIAVVVVASVVVAATVGFNQSFKNEVPYDTSKAIVAPETEVVQVDTVVEVEDPASGDGIVVFKEKTLEVMLEEIAKSYGKKVVFKSPETKKLRLYFQWDRSMPIDAIIGQLNSFESFNVKLIGDNIIID